MENPGVNWCLGVGVFLAWLVGMSALAGILQTVAFASGLEKFGGGEYLGIVVALSALREQGPGIAVTAACFAFVAGLHRRSGLAWYPWLLFAAVPATPVSALIIIAAALAFGSGLYSLPVAELRHHMATKIDIFDLTAGLEMALQYAIVLWLTLPPLLRWTARRRWTLWQQLGGAWVVANLARVPIFLAITLLCPAEGEDTQEAIPAGPALSTGLVSPPASVDPEPEGHASCGCFDPERAHGHPTEPYALAKCRDEEGYIVSAATCSLTERRELGRMDFRGAKLQLSATIRWVPDSTNVIVAWGAGSGIGLAELYDLQGKELLDVYAAGVDVSEDGRFLAVIATYDEEHRGQPGASPDAPPHLAIYDLRNASRVHERTDCDVLHLHWEGKQLAVECEGKAKPLTLALP